MFFNCDPPEDRGDVYIDEDEKAVLKCRIATLESDLVDLTALRAEVEALRKVNAVESRRVDYLMRTGFCIKQMNDTGLFMSLHGDYPCTGGEYDTALEALDELMAYDATIARIETND